MCVCVCVCVCVEGGGLVFAELQTFSPFFTLTIRLAYSLTENKAVFYMQMTRYSDDVIQAQRTHGGIMHRSFMISV